MLCNHDINMISDLLRDAGKNIAMKHFRQLKQDDINKKSRDDDLVTIADIAIDKYLINHLKPVIKNAHFISEETFSNNSYHDDENYVWIIDPIDGTWHYAHGEMNFCIMLALAKAGKCYAAWLYFPYDNILFYADETQDDVIRYDDNNNRIDHITCSQYDDIEMKGMISSFFVMPKNHNHMINRQEFRKNIHETLGPTAHVRSAGYAARMILENDWQYCCFMTLKSWDHAPIIYLLNKAKAYTISQDNIYRADKTAHHIILCQSYNVYEKLHNFIQHYQ